MKNKMRNVFLLLASSMLLTGCVYDTGGMKAAVRLEAEGNDPFTITTDLASEKQIHTAAQATYLAYDGDYASIPTADYPDGRKHLSDPNSVNLAWNYTPEAGKTLSRYDVVFGKEADLSDGYTVQGTTANSLDIYNSYLGDNYFKVVANYSDGSKAESAIQKYKVENIYPRNLKIDGMTNCRDMGGARQLEDGGYIKQGLIFRTSGTNDWGGSNATDVPDDITNDGKVELLQHLGVKTEIDVNNSGSNKIGVENYVGAYMYYDGGKHHLYRNAEPIKTVFHALSDANNYPVFYHCRIGTDRTGLCAILISGLLGVPENLIYQDYLFSNFGNIQEKRYIGEAAGRDNILNYIADLKAFPGEKFQNKVYNYLLSVGVPASELNNVIDILTEGTKPQGNDNYQEVMMADSFTSDLEMKTSTSAAHPTNYYTLTAEGSITASFDAKYDGEAKLVAYLGSTDSSSSKKIADALDVTFDGVDVDIDEEMTFANAGFGTGASRTYYAGVVLGTVSVAKGYTEIVITGVSDNLNIGAVSVIAPNKVKNDDNGGDNGGSAKKGCFGSVTAASSLIALIAFAGVGVLLLKRKQEKAQ